LATVELCFDRQVLMVTLSIAACTGCRKRGGGGGGRAYQRGQEPDDQVEDVDAEGVRDNVPALSKVTAAM
jgi:hypothetical protein